MPGILNACLLVASIAKGFVLRLTTATQKGSLCLGNPVTCASRDFHRSFHLHWAVFKRTDFHTAVQTVQSVFSLLNWLTCGFEATFDMAVVTIRRVLDHSTSAKRRPRLRSARDGKVPLHRNRTIFSHHGTINPRRRLLNPIIEPLERERTGRAGTDHSGNFFCRRGLLLGKLITPGNDEFLTDNIRRFELVM